MWTALAQTGPLGNELLVQILTGATGVAVVQGLLAYLRSRQQASKVGAEADSVSVTTMREVLGDVREELDRARQRIAELEAELKAERAARRRETSRLASVAEKAQAETSDLRAEVELLRAEVARLRRRA